MGFNPSAADSGAKGGYEVMPAGPVAARCARIIEIGTQEDKYGRKDKAIIAFSIPGHLIEIDGERKQRFMSNPFGINLSNNEASTMFQYTKALNPEAKNLGDFLNKTCQLYISHYKKPDGSKGDQIDSIAAIMPGYEVPELDTEPFWFKWDDPDPALWDMIPDFTKRLIREALNYPGSKVEAIDNAAEQTSY